MGYTIPIEKIIDYSPEKLREFHSYGYEYIDNRQFALKPEVVLGTIERALPYVEEAKRLFLEMDWQGDGDVELLWIPPFAFPLSLKVSPVGIVIWHVKQSEDGISYLLSPIELPFEEFSYANAA
ncbi:hypothetical protein [Duganella sp. Root336D2]|jgi:hypothetical protein|uniref:hypothetical protein n=1 Tax=Duganella sp. Root336D2 TaxID=1736518 RepID=UPI0006FD25EC|nr:hypothetical protein [Duganella sp. Root336D2]KQV51514.1 hypothetical protein ASD07_29610 [Duganella sp. Root336D2]